MKNHQKNVTFSIPADMAGESGFAPEGVDQLTAHGGQGVEGLHQLDGGFIILAPVHHGGV